jgi:hypothetical protein
MIDFGLARCPHCGTWHSGSCPRIKSITYRGDGSIERIEYHPVVTTTTRAPPWKCPLCRCQPDCCCCTPGHCGCKENRLTT